MSIKREQLAERYDKTLAEIEKIKSEEEVYLYATKDKYLPKVGYIHEVESITELLKAQAIVNKQKNQEFKDVAEQLGITDDEMPKNEVSRLMGLKTSYWDKDLKTRLEELRNKKRLDNLMKDADLLRRNLNEDDVFKLDMMELSDEDL